MIEAMEALEPATREVFRMRMEHQCMRIKAYRMAVLRDSGRTLSLDEAAQEWIERYAATFDTASAIE